MVPAERDGLIILIIGIVSLFVALLVVGFGFLAGAGADTASNPNVIAPTVDAPNITPLPTRPPFPTPTSRLGEVLIIEPSDGPPGDPATLVPLATTVVITSTYPNIPSFPSTPTVGSGTVLPASPTLTAPATGPTRTPPATLPTGAVPIPSSTTAPATTVPAATATSAGPVPPLPPTTATPDPAPIPPTPDGGYPAPIPIPTVPYP